MSAWIRLPSGRYLNLDLVSEVIKETDLLRVWFAFHNHEAGEQANNVFEGADARAIEAALDFRVDNA